MAEFEIPEIAIDHDVEAALAELLYAAKVDPRGRVDGCVLDRVPDPGHEVWTAPVEENAQEQHYFSNDFGT